MKTPEEGYAKGWADAIYNYESKQRKDMSTIDDLTVMVRAYGAACAAAEREAAARICEKYFHSTCAKAIRARGTT